MSAVGNAFLQHAAPLNLLEKVVIHLKVIYMHSAVHALKLVLYLCLSTLLINPQIYSGRPPFSDLGEAAVIFKVLQGRRPELFVEGTPIPKDICDLIWRCWAHQPHERPTIRLVTIMLELSSEVLSFYLYCRHPFDISPTGPKACKVEYRRQRSLGEDKYGCSIL
jgi:hypothetical protein